MQALAFWKTIIVDQSNFLDKLVALLNERKIRYCVIGGQAVNAFAEPLEQIPCLFTATESRFQPESPKDSTPKAVNQLGICSKL